MRNFWLNMPTEIFFGRNQIEVLSKQLKKEGVKSVLLAYGHRSEERRVGKECPSECRSRWSPYH